jgi:hypothetical protein
MFFRLSSNRLNINIESEFGSIQVLMSGTTRLCRSVGSEPIRVLDGGRNGKLKELIPSRVQMYYHVGVILLLGWEERVSEKWCS